jgi:glycosyltransferase involved in cell wall biosynthesis
VFFSLSTPHSSSKPANARPNVREAEIQPIAREVHPTPRLICFSPIDWDDVWEGPQEIMSRFAALGSPVLFVENILGRTPRLNRQDAWRVINRLRRLSGRGAPAVPVPPNLRVLTPSVLPPYRVAMVRKVNERLLLRGLRRELQTMPERPTIVWSYNPSSLALYAARGLEPDLLVYCCIHDFSSLSRDHSGLVAEEEAMMRAADLVFILSRQLLERKKHLNRNAQLLPQGANLSDYVTAIESRETVATELDRIAGPVIGYIGSIHEFVDIELLCAIANARPEWTLVLVGPEKVSTAKLRELPNVKLLGMKPHQALPHYVRRFDAGIIPYVTAGFGQTIRPNKVLEYLIMGKPVITTPLPELAEHSAFITQAAGPRDFVAAIDLALTSDCETLRATGYEMAVSRSINRSFQELHDRVLAELGKRQAAASSAGCGD